MNAIKLVLLILAAILAQRFVDWPFLQPVTFALIGLLIVSFVWSRLSLRGIGLARSLETDRLQVGQTVRDRLTVSNSRRFAALWLEVLDYSSLPGHAASRVVHVRGRSTSSWTQATVCTRRGVYRTGPVMLHSGDPFGLFPVSGRMPLTQELLVYPATFDVTGYVLPGGQLIGQGRQSRRNPFVNPSVAGVREYIQGDALNRISWTTSARLGRLMVKEFDLDPTSDVWIVADLERRHHRRASADHPGHAGRRTPDWLDSTEEYVVSIAASLAKMALDDGRAVGMVVSSGRTTVINPDRTERQLRRVLEQLALEHADGVRPLQEVLLSESYRFRRQSALIVVSPSPDEGWTTSLAAIAGRRVPVSAVILDATTFGTSQSAQTVIGRLVANSIPVQRISFGDDISFAMSTQLGDARPGNRPVEQVLAG